jgi:four helix bundle protein
MALITRFEEIEGWQKARELTRSIYEITSQGAFARDFSLKDQIRRAGVFSMSNVAEGFEREGNKEFVQFLTLAKSSSAEVKSHLYVALDARFITEAQFKRTYQLADETGKLIGGFMRYLGNSPYPGPQIPVSVTAFSNSKPETRNSKL